MLGYSNNQRGFSQSFSGDSGLKSIAPSSVPSGRPNCSSSNISMRSSAASSIGVSGCLVMSLVSSPIAAREPMRIIIRVPPSLSVISASLGPPPLSVFNHRLFVDVVAGLGVSFKLC